MTFQEHKFFSSVSSFYVSISSSLRFFINNLINLFSDESSFDAGTINSFDVLPSAFTELAYQTMGSLQQPDPQPRSQPSSPHRSRVTPYLNDYYCYFALATLYESRYFHEARFDPLWQKAWDEELQTLIKIQTWDMVDLPPRKSVVGRNGSTKSKRGLMFQLNTIKPAQQQRVLLRNMMLIIKRLLHWYLASHLSIFTCSCCCSLLGFFSNECQKLPFSMGILLRKFICNLLLDIIIHLIKSVVSVRHSMA